MATKQYGKINQQIVYIKLGKYSVLKIKMSNICLNHLNDGINRILGLVLNIAQVYSARPENRVSLGNVMLDFLSLGG